MSKIETESPPALGAEGQCIAVGANAEAAYTIKVPRAMLEGAIGGLIELLDRVDGDSDAEDADPGENDDPDEAAGDELDGSDSEDEALSQRAVRRGYGPGCIASDPDVEHCGREEDDGL